MLAHTFDPPKNATLFPLKDNLRLPGFEGVLIKSQKSWMSQCIQLAITEFMDNTMFTILPIDIT